MQAYYHLLPQYAPSTNEKKFEGTNAIMQLVKNLRVLKDRERKNCFSFPEKASVGGTFTSELLSAYVELFLSYHH